MSEHNHDHADLSKEAEEVAYETRFLLNILLDVLVKKNVITEAEFKQEYDAVIAKLNSNPLNSNN